METLNADLGRVLPQAVGELDAFVATGRRHTNVCDHHVGLQTVDSARERRKIGTGLEQLDVVVQAEQGDDAFAHEQ